MDHIQCNNHVVAYIEKKRTHSRIGMCVDMCPYFLLPAPTYISLVSPGTLPISCRNVKICINIYENEHITFLYAIYQVINIQIPRLSDFKKLNYWFN